MLYAYGSGAASWGDEKGPVIQLKADRARYRVGETAKVLVASPFDEAEALITVEREGVLSVEQRRIVGRAATLEISVDSRFVPNAFVTVLLVRPTSGEAAVVGANDVPFRVGSVEIKTDTEQHHLRVAVIPDAAEKRPGDSLDVAFEVKDGSGKPQKAELTVFAVDEGVLALTGYKTPDPFDVFYAPRALQVWTADARGSLARFVHEEEKGGTEGGGGGDGSGTRTNFDALAFYAPEVVTDDAGRAKVSFKLPDSLTRYRIMAVAVSRGADAGAGAADVRTKKPLMLRPALPRALRVGDVFEAGATVHNDSAEDMEVELRAEVEGVVLSSDKTQRVSVPKGGAVEARFKMRADKAGQVVFRFGAKAARETDALSVTRDVALPTPLETVSTTGQAQGTLREGIQAMQGVRSDAGGLEVLMSTTALASLGAPAQALVDYRYNCTEQLASRLVGMAAMLRLSAKGAFDVDAELPARIDAVLGELERHQRADGAFGLWSREEWELPPALAGFLTSYALLALEEARVAKITVNSHAISSAQAWLTQYLRDVREQPRRDANQASATLAVYALARTGQADASYLGTLYERRASLDLASQVALGHALALGNKEQESQTLFDLVLTRLRMTADEAHVEANVGDAYAVVLASDLRATAQLVLWLLGRDEKHVLLPKLARWLSSSRKLDGTWGTTQDNAWGLIALARYAESVEKDTPDLRVTARLDAKKLGEAVLQGRKAAEGLFVPMASLGNKGSDIELTSTGTGTLHYTLRLSYARDTLRATPEERGFYVERSYERIEPVALARGEAQGEAGAWANVGDYVRVTVQVVVPATRRFVMIEDPLPAGLEPVNLTFSTETQSAGSALSEYQGPHNHSELRDTLVAFAATELEPGIYRYQYLARASTPGTFVAPPAGAHEMYHPETYGQTGATTYEVRAR